MFPTHVGMNRAGVILGHFGVDVPHTRGDEPALRADCADMNSMFPTHVGMNRPTTKSCAPRIHVPHTRGDEPAFFTFVPTRLYMFPTHVGMNRPSRPRESSHLSCSPHTWG